MDTHQKLSTPDTPNSDTDHVPSSSTRPTGLLAHFRTTRTDNMSTDTTPTTSSTSRLFSLPYRSRKRSAVPHAPIQPSHSIDGPSSSTLHANSRPVTPMSPFDKALPPTPLDESDDMAQMSASVDVTPRISTSSSPTLARARNLSSGNSSTSILAHAALGLGLTHASAGFQHEPSTIPFASTSTSSSLSVPIQTSSVRKVKSSQRIQLRHASDTHENVSKGEQMARRRQRGISLTATSLFNRTGEIDGKGKEKEVSSADATPSKPLSRKSSFWSKKRPTQLHEPSVVLDPPTLPLSMLPPMTHSSPFRISLSSSPPKNSESQSPRLSASHSENHAMGASSATSCDGSVSGSWTNVMHASTSNPHQGLRSHTDQPPTLRTRAQTNTPILRRLSMGMFSSGDSSPVNVHSNILPQALSASPLLTFSKVDIPVPKPGADDSPDKYVTRLKSSVSKADIAGILASSPDRFYAQALRSFVTQFNFINIPIDVALRKLLMEVGLPRETQQIDRVMEAFASRYMECNPNIFTSEDHPYILAFSLIMLHTDTFNPSNKRKMTKADYIKNTSLPGIPVEVLDCFFDNIVFAPFIYIEDPVDPHVGYTSSPSIDSSRAAFLTSPTSVTPSTSGPGSFKLGNKVDPYFLITNNLLQPLRVEVNSLIPPENPFTYKGSKGPWDEHKLHSSFLHALVVEVSVPLAPRTMFGIGSANSAHLSPIAGSSSSSVNSKYEICEIKITKVGVLNRKDDLLEGGRKASNRKWRPWSIIITGYQLVLFRTANWATALSKPFDKPSQTWDGAPLTELFRPDEAFSLKDTIAIYDRSYTKYAYTMRLVLPDGRQTLFQAPDDESLNEWIALINYASTFKSTGVRMRPPALSGEDVMLTGVAAATSHLHDMQSRSGVRPPRSWDNDIAHDLMDMLSGHSAEKPLLKRRVTAHERNSYDLDPHVAPEIEGAEQFKATFDQVKADLAADSWSSLNPSLSGNNTIYTSPSVSATSLHNSSPGPPSRTQIIQHIVADLDAKMRLLQVDLDDELRHVRNIAILTPFQKSTRSRLATAIQTLSKRIAMARIEMEKTKCYRDVLRYDIASEGRSWNQSKQIALQAAKDTLQSRMDHSTPIPEPSDNVTLAQKSPGVSRPSHHPDSSADESFYSATDFGIDWPSSEDLTTLASADKFSRRATSPVNLQRPVSHPETSSSFDDPDDSNLDEDEQAEDWNRTRCAQRVSLIHVPSNIGPLTRLRNTVDQSQ